MAQRLRPCVPGSFSPSDRFRDTCRVMHKLPPTALTTCVLTGARTALSFHGYCWKHAANSTNNNNHNNNSNNNNNNNSTSAPVLVAVLVDTWATRLYN